MRHGATGRPRRGWAIAQQIAALISSCNRVRHGAGGTRARCRVSFACLRYVWWIALNTFKLKRSKRASWQILGLSLLRLNSILTSPRPSLTLQPIPPPRCVSFKCVLIERSVTLAGQRERERDCCRRGTFQQWAFLNVFMALLKEADYEISSAVTDWDWDSSQFGASTLAGCVFLLLRLVSNFKREPGGF